MDTTAGTLSFLGNMFIGIVAWVIAYTELPADKALILAVLMAINFFSSIIRSSIVGHPITCRKLTHSVLSKLLIIGIPFVLALMAKGVDQDLSPIVNWSISALILTEGYKFISDAYTVATGKKLPEWDFGSILHRQMRNLVDKVDRDLTD